MWKGLLAEYEEFLPITERTPPLTLHEGNTPLILLENLSKRWSVTIYGKIEGANPSGSFKDRDMVMAVAKAKEAGSGAIICASTGNTSSSAAAIVHGHKIEEPETIATAIRIGNPASWEQAVLAAEQSRGKIDEVTDREILESYEWLAKYEGIFAEPASCASLAGVYKQLQSGEIAKGSQIVAVLTGNGLKDPNIAIDTKKIQPIVLPNDEKVVFDYIQEAVFQ
ncbi:pyridoxal-phosphate dependent enzyme [Bacillus pseudomycoides]|uniref:pyridoxal-phosphate dependent enzyme n=1 Tax=Bacillus pseudomycoides TaxID=64104 RepID=UPI001FB40D57|nr:pyridoxal-phosphate dependent enzyme [Bacillus pseudomycoides]